RHLPKCPLPTMAVFPPLRDPLLTSFEQTTCLIPFSHLGLLLYALTAVILGDRRSIASTSPGLAARSLRSTLRGPLGVLVVCAPEPRRGVGRHLPTSPRWPSRRGIWRRGAALLLLR